MMMKKNLNFSEWLGLVTSVSALYSYIYYYKYWRFFGINAYDYFSYIDALQHSIPSIIMVLTLSQALILSFTYHIFLIGKQLFRFIGIHIAWQKQTIIKMCLNNLLFYLF